MLLIGKGRPVRVYLDNLGFYILKPLRADKKRRKVALKKTRIKLPKHIKTVKQAQNYLIKHGSKESKTKNIMFDQSARDAADEYHKKRVQLQLTAEEQERKDLRDFQKEQEKQVLKEQRELKRNELFSMLFDRFMLRQSDTNRQVDRDYQTIEEPDTNDTKLDTRMIKGVPFATLVDTQGNTLAPTTMQSPRNVETDFKQPPESKTKINNFILAEKIKQLNEKRDAEDAAERQKRLQKREADAKAEHIARISKQHLQEQRQTALKALKAKGIAPPKRESNETPEDYSVRIIKMAEDQIGSSDQQEMAIDIAEESKQQLKIKPQVTFDEDTRAEREKRKQQQLEKKVVLPDKEKLKERSEQRRMEQEDIIGEERHRKENEEAKQREEFVNEMSGYLPDTGDISIDEIADIYNRLPEPNDPLSDTEQKGNGLAKTKKSTYHNPHGLDALYNDEIDEYFTKEPKYAGCIASDQVRSLVKFHPPMGFVMNISTSKQVGSHWVACYISPSSVEYYDSTGFPPSKKFITDIHWLLSKWKLPAMMKMKINRVKDQNSTTNYCGYHSVRFLHDRFHGIPYDLTTKFNKPIVNKSQEGKGNIEREFGYI